MKIVQTISAACWSRPVLVDLKTCSLCFCHLSLHTHLWAVFGNQTLIFLQTYPGM